MRAAEEKGLGWGNDLAPPGSVEHAKRWRLDMQAAVDDMDRCPDFIDALKATGDKWQVWTLLKDKSGCQFATFKAFCEEERPFGLGTPEERILQALALKVGKRAVQLATVAPLRPANQHTVDASYHDDKKQPGPPATRARLHAILRAPEQVQDLYRAGLIGQVEAARLGPKNPTPEQAADAVRVANAATETARRRPAPKTETEKRCVQREVNKAVRAATKGSAAASEPASMPSAPPKSFSTTAARDTAKTILDALRIARGAFGEADWRALLSDIDNVVAVREQRADASGGTDAGR